MATIKPFKSDCAICDRVEVCGEQPADGKAKLLNPLEVQIEYFEFTGRVIVGQCLETNEDVHHDLGKDLNGKPIDEDTIHTMRNDGMDTITINLTKLSPAVPASLTVTEAMRMQDITPPKDFTLRFLL